MPVQELGEPLTENQLKNLRTKCDPTREKRKKRNLNPEDIAGFCDVVRDNPTMPLKALLALVNPQFASVRATADGRARAATAAGRGGGRGRLTRGGAGCAGAGARRAAH